MVQLLWECSEGLKVEWRQCPGISIPQIVFKNPNYHKHAKLVYEIGEKDIAAASSSLLK